LERKAFEVNAENADSKEKLVFGVQSDRSDPKALKDPKAIWEKLGFQDSTVETECPANQDWTEFLVVVVHLDLMEFQAWMDCPDRLDTTA
jgi:hypothetical protein